MEINKDSIVTSVCGIDSNITLEELSKHLNIDVEVLLNGEDWSRPNGYHFDSNYFDLYEKDDDTLEFHFNGYTEMDEGITHFLENVFNEEYLMRVDRDVSCNNEYYKDVTIFDKGEEIVLHITKLDGGKLTPEEEEMDIEVNGYVNSVDISFVKKSSVKISDYK